jgi:hypothetical protein
MGCLDFATYFLLKERNSWAAEGLLLSALTIALHDVDASCCLLSSLEFAPLSVPWACLDMAAEAAGVMESYRVPGHSFLKATSALGQA